MEIFKFLKDYPEIGAIAIATVSGAIGFFVRSIVSYYTEKSKKQLELKEVFWKEKIQASKKASEYYLHHMSFISLTADRYEMLENNKPENKELIKSTEKIIEIYKNRLLEFPHFEHHHINLFYDFDGTKTSEIVKEDYKCFQNIGAIEFYPNDTLEIINHKLEKLSENFKILKINSNKINDIYKGHLSTIREDLKKIPK